LWLLQPWSNATAQTVRFNPVPREVVETRLGKYTGNDDQREATLMKMFAEAGCDDRHLSEQPVKGSKLPNVICNLPGSSGKIIIVGAHFDHVPAEHHCGSGRAEPASAETPSIAAALVDLGPRAGDGLAQELHGGHECESVLL
jgi:hypothetical protein